MNKPIFATLALACLTAANAFADYTGTPFRGTAITVPGTVEAEDYDQGGEGVAYQWGTASGGDKSYRSDTKGIGNGGSGHNLGWTDNGIWTRYTINVTEEGDYRIDAIVSAGSDNGKFDFKLDGVTVCRVQKVENNGWDNYFAVPVEGIHLKGGQHVFTFNCYGGMNADKFVFTRTGELTGNYDNGSYTYTYPMTQTYEQNPLFVNFPSPMYGNEDGFPGTMYTADPSARVWNINGEDVLYVYCSHDMEPSKGCDRMDRYHVYSTKDLREWTDHGEILKAEDVNKQFGYTCPGFMWAPDCVYNPADKLYYYYFPHPIDGNDWGGTFRVFVATSSDPATGFTVKKVIEGLPPRIDPNVFIDDDGQPYIYVGGGAHVYGCKLKKNDWTTLEGTPVEMSGMEDFHEGAWVFKHNGRYYLTYPDNHSPALGGNRMRYATSDNPLGPWTPGGIYMYPHGHETAHGSVVKFKGQYYQFYHIANLSDQGELRTVCVDPLYINADGGIEVVRNWGTPYGGTLPSVSFGYRTVLPGNHYNEGGINPGRCYSVNVTETANYTIRVFAVRKKDVECKMLLAVDGVNVQTSETRLSGSVGTAVEYTFSNVHMTPGEHTIEWRLKGGDLSIDRIEIGKASDPVSAISPITIGSDSADGAWYSLAGVRTDTPVAGVYIRNGRKMVVGR